MGPGRLLFPAIWILVTNTSGIQGLNVILSKLRCVCLRTPRTSSSVDGACCDVRQIQSRGDGKRSTSARFLCSTPLPASTCTCPANFLMVRASAMHHAARQTGIVVRVSVYGFQCFDTPLTFIGISTSTVQSPTASEIIHHLKSLWCLARTRISIPHCSRIILYRRCFLILACALQPNQYTF
jgi:hypothetical protein